MIIGGDIGGTKARLGLFKRDGNTLNLVVTERYTSREFPGLEAILATFLEQHHSDSMSSIEAGCFGLPGPVVNGRVKVTNLPWEVVQKDVGIALHTDKVKLVNDLVSTAAAIPTLGTGSLTSVYPGKGNLDSAGSAVVVAPGTGLGHALVHREGSSTTFLASEGGHANFAPTNDIEVDLLRHLQKKLTHVSVESVLCGPGLINIYDFLRDSDRAVESPELISAFSSQDKASVITASALSGTHAICVETLELFCSILGSHCSNMVLNYLATGGVFLGGGIPPKIIPALLKGSFVQGYLKKGKCLERVEATPVAVINDDKASLFGAGAIAASL
jgi:glucokinase